MSWRLPKGTVFVTVPILFCDGNKPAEQVLLMHLCRYSNQDHECWPSVRLLCEKCGIKKPALLRALHSLEEKGLVVTEQRHRDDGSRTSNKYRLEFPDVADEQGGNQKLHRGYGEVTPIIKTHELTISNTSKDVLNTVYAHETDEFPAFDPAEDTIKQWNDITSRIKLPIVRDITPKRRVSVKRMLRDVSDPQAWQQFWSTLAKSTHLAGEGWFGFDWCFKSIENFDKVRSDWTGFRRKKKEIKTDDPRFFDSEKGLHVRKGFEKGVA